MQVLSSGVGPRVDVCLQLVVQAFSGVWNSPSRCHENIVVIRVRFSSMKSLSPVCISSPTSSDYCVIWQAREASLISDITSYIPLGSCRLRLERLSSPPLGMFQWCDAHLAWRSMAIRRLGYSTKWWTYMYCCGLRVFQRE